MTCVCRGVGTNQTGGSQGWNCCDRAETPFSVSGEEPHRELREQLRGGERRGLWPMQRWAVPHAGGLPGEGEEAETGC